MAFCCKKHRVFFLTSIIPSKLVAQFRRLHVIAIITVLILQFYSSTPTQSEEAILPKISITAVSPIVEEGEQIQFEIRSDTISSSDIHIRLQANDDALAVLHESYMSLIVSMEQGKNSFALAINTVDNEEKEENNTIIMTLVPEDPPINYVVDQMTMSATVTVTDND